MSGGEGNQIAFQIGSAGFVAINNENNDFSQTFSLSLPAGNIKCINFATHSSMLLHTCVYIFKTETKDKMSKSACHFSGFRFLL